MRDHPLYRTWAAQSPWPAAWRAAQASGDTGLMPHQELAAQVAAATLRQLPGFLLASPVGAGKTRTALRVAALLEQPVSVLCPASLRPMWQEELAGSGEVFSYDALLHQSLPARPFWICDEAHELRNPDTRRHRALASLTGNAPLLLLTATPVQNGLHDLTALLQLFVSDATALAITGHPLATLLDSAHDEGLHLLLERVALRLSADRLAAATASATTPQRQRRYTRIAMTAPAADDLVWLDDAAEAAALHPAERPLLQATLLRRLLSSNEAAAASLARLERFLRRAAEAAAAGGTMDRRTFARTFADEREGGPAQLMFPFWYQSNDPPLPAPDALLERADRLAHHRRNALAQRYGDRDATRALCERLQAARCTVAFTDHLDTAQAAARAFRKVARVALWTGNGLHSDHLPTADLPTTLRNLRNAVEQSDGPWCLIATSVGAQGHNLQFADQLFHLDLPWNPARVEQREGRIDRPGGRARLPIFALTPPRPLEQRLRLLERLERKQQTAQAAALPLQPSETGDPWSPLLDLTIATHTPSPRLAPALTGEPPEQLLVAFTPLGPWLRRPGRVWRPLSAASIAALCAANLRALSPQEQQPLEPRATRWLALLAAEQAALARLAARPAPARLRQAARKSWKESGDWADAGLFDEARRALEPLERWSRADRPRGRSAAPTPQHEPPSPTPPHLWLEAAAPLLNSLLAERSTPS